MDFRNEVKLKYIGGNLETGSVHEVRGIIVGESRDAYTIAEIERKIIINKRFVIEIENLASNRRHPDFDFGRV